MLRLLSGILSVVVVFFIAIPCNDIHPENTRHNTEVAHHYPLDSQDDDHSQGAGHCSPFCVCQCCQTFCYLPNPVFSTPTNGLAVGYREYTFIPYNADLFDFPKPPETWS